MAGRGRGGSLRSAESQSDFVRPGRSLDQHRPRHGIRRHPLKTICYDQARVGQWVAERIGGSFNPALARAIGLESDGQLVAGVVFDNYRHNSIAMHVAGEGGHWMTREFARTCFKYAFGQLGVKKILGFVDSDNEPARRFDERIGFQLEYVIKDASERGDLCIYSMTPDQCRWR